MHMAGASAVVGTGGVVAVASGAGGIVAAGVVGSTVGEAAGVPQAAKQ